LRLGAGGKGEDRGEGDHDFAHGRRSFFCGKGIFRLPPSRRKDRDPPPAGELSAR
jgi:hypothetical protein